MIFPHDLSARREGAYVSVWLEDRAAVIRRDACRWVKVLSFRKCLRGAWRRLPSPTPPRWAAERAKCESRQASEADFPRASHATRTPPVPPQVGFQVCNEPALRSFYWSDLAPSRLDSTQNPSSPKSTGPENGRSGGLEILLALAMSDKPVECTSDRKQGQ